MMFSTGRSRSGPASSTRKGRHCARIGRRSYLFLPSYWPESRRIAYSGRPFAPFGAHFQSVKPWPELLSKTACTMSRTSSSSCCWPRSARDGSPTAPSPRLRGRTTRRPWSPCARSQPATSPPKCSASLSRRLPLRCPIWSISQRSGPRSSASETDLLRNAPMDYASSLLGLLPGGRRTPGLKELLSSVESYLPPEQVERIREAAEFGASAHKGQKRLSGEPYIAHPVAAAAILADLHLDPDTIIAAILHDVIEDTPTPKDQLAARFGADVAELVDGVTKLDQIKFKSREEAQAESFRKMLLAMVRDLRVILVKLADRTHNMRTIEAMVLPRRRAIGA